MSHFQSLSAAASTTTAPYHSSNANSNNSSNNNNSNNINNRNSPPLNLSPPRRSPPQKPQLQVPSEGSIISQSLNYTTPPVSRFTPPTPRSARFNRPEELSFEEGRKKALEATELALASPRTRDAFQQDELNWETTGIGAVGTKVERPNTQQFYAQAQQQSNEEPTSASSSQRQSPPRERRPSEGEEYTTRPSPQRTHSDSSNESSSAYPVVTRTGSGGKRSNPSLTAQTRLMPLSSVPESVIARQQQGSAQGQRSMSPSGASGGGGGASTGAPPFLRTTPRSSSIDSAISTVSAGGATNGTTNPPGTEDVAALIAAAGSAETLIQHMLKDKAQAASQNAQLWRLVDKQRSMILSLNRDLEKAMKDKERYRKKLKDQLATVPPLPESVRGMNISPTPSEDPSLRERSMSVESGMTSRSEMVKSPEEESLAPYPITPPQGFDQMQSIRQAIEERMPDARAHIKQAEAEVAVTVAAQRGVPVALELEQKSHLKVDAPLQTPGTLSRKKTPAPLQLQSMNQGYSVQEDAAKEPVKGKENITQPKKDLPFRSQDATVSGSTFPEPPLSPRLAPDGNSVPDAIKNTTLAAPGGGLLAKRQMNKNLNIALKSPTLPGVVGLPLSPRPTDRPMGSPMFAPRAARDIGMKSPLLSPRGFGLPSTPRQGGFGLPSTPRGGAFPGSPRLLSPRMKQSFMTNMSAEQSVGSLGEAMMGSGGLGIAPPMKSLQKQVVEEVKAPGDFKNDTGLEGIAQGANTKLMVIPPALQTLDPQVLSSRIKTIKGGSDAMKGQTKETLVFTMAVLSRGNGNELWRVEKDVSTIAILDASMRKFANLNNFYARLPDKTLYQSHAPAKVDARKLAIEEYFLVLVNTIPLDPRAGQVLCEYLSADIIDSQSSSSDSGSIKDVAVPTADAPPGTTTTAATTTATATATATTTTATTTTTAMSKEGYLTKRGKNFGGWKSRYFILDGPVLRYFETPEGAHLGSIRLPQAQIGKQSNAAPAKGEGEGGASDADNQYRHAFLILEPKRKDSGSVVRHVLCAESDAERDEWVECLMQYVGDKEVDPADAIPEKRRDAKEAKEANDSPSSSTSDLRAVPYAATVPGEAPARGPTPTEGSSRSTPPPQAQASKTAISGPVAGGVITDAANWGNKPTSHSEKPKKKGIWGFRNKTSEHVESQQNLPQPGKIPSNRSVFGAMLFDAVEISRPVGVDLEIPSVVYRTIEYLDAKNVAQEEGIFRLSGSNTTIKLLRERFNTESDVRLLLDEEYHDVHAVAGLLKLYLRELPSTVLTRELHGEFVSVLENEDKVHRVHHLNSLVHRLPIENYTLLKLLASHLITIVDNSDINKMTVRNVGIVFSPTLNIPAGVFSLFLMEFGGIFIRPGEEGYEEPLNDTLVEHNANNTVSTTLTIGGGGGGGIGLPSTPRRMQFDTDPLAEEKRRRDQANFRALMEKEEADRTAAGNGGLIGQTTTLAVPEQRKKKRESAMLGLFSSNKAAAFSQMEKEKKKGNEISPNLYDEEKSIYD